MLSVIALFLKSLVQFHCKRRVCVLRPVQPKIFCLCISGGEYILNIEGALCLAKKGCIKLSSIV
jgi:hypothetical protein